MQSVRLTAFRKYYPRRSVQTTHPVHRHGLALPHALLFELPFSFYGLLGTSHNSLLKFILITHGILCKPLDLTQHHLFQEVHTDIMGRSAAAPATVVIGAVEIFDIVIALVEMVVQVVAANPRIPADRKTYSVLHLWVSVCGFSHAFPGPVPRRYGQ